MAGKKQATKTQAKKLILVRPISRGTLAMQDADRSSQFHNLDFMQSFFKNRVRVYIFKNVASWVAWLLGVSWGIADQEAHCVCGGIGQTGFSSLAGPNSSPFITTTHGPVLCHTPGSSDVSFLMRLARSRHRLRCESCTPTSIPPCGV